MSYLGCFSEDTVTQLYPRDGDVAVVFRPSYARHEVWTWDLSPGVVGWLYLGQGSEAECIAAAIEAGA